MSVKYYIVPRIAERLLGPKALLKKRAKAESLRRKSGSAHIVEFFHDPADPYSQLLKQVLPELAARYDIRIKTRYVSPPDDGAAPEPDALKAYSQIDAARLAKKAGIDFTFKPSPPAEQTSEGDARRKVLGYYLGGALYYGGEWYWGLDRLHYLEDRLMALGLGVSESPIYTPPKVPEGTGKTTARIHWYLSFRSPYTGIVASRVKALADAYGAELELRFVLPMIMRGLPVPKAKAQYIIKDTAREARRLGVPFGRVCDPVGAPVERGYSLLPWAIEQERGFEFTSSFLSNVWARGIDAGTDKGLRKITEEAGLDWTEAKSVLGNEDWRTEAEANRAEMMDLGIWGVPSFRINETITWGQDRLWVIEDALQKLSKP